MQREQKITLGEMRESGPRRLLVYCADYRCAHSVVIDADQWGDHIRLSDLEPKFVCLAGIAGPMSGRCLSRLAWAQTPRFLLNLSGSGATYARGRPHGR
jgi:hypothetical protein